MKTIEKTEGLWPTMSNVMDVYSNEVSEWNGKNVSNIGRTLPFVNILESQKEYTIELAVPGMNKEDFKIEHTNHILTVSSKHEEEKTVKQVDESVYTRKEFSYTSFFRSFTLPSTVENDEIHATYKEGILRVVVVKKPVSSPKTSKAITIK